MDDSSPIRMNNRLDEIENDKKNYFSHKKFIHVSAVVDIVFCLISCSEWIVYELAPILFWVPWRYDFNCSVQCAFDSSYITSFRSPAPSIELEWIEIQSQRIFPFDLLSQSLSMIRNSGNLCGDEHWIYWLSAKFSGTFCTILILDFFKSIWNIYITHAACDMRLFECNSGRLFLIDFPHHFPWENIFSMTQFVGDDDDEWRERNAVGRCVYCYYHCKYCIKWDLYSFVVIERYIWAFHVATSTRDRKSHSVFT